MNSSDGAARRHKSALRRLLAKPLAAACLVYLVLVIGVAILAPVLLPDIAGEQAGDLLRAKELPSSEHLLGTDSLGRDVLSRLLVGTRTTVLGVGIAVATALLIGVPFGMLAGLLGGAADRVISWMTDIFLALPSIVLVIIVLAVFPQSMTAAMVALGALTAPGVIRMVRSASRSVGAELYVAAARVSGLRWFYVGRKHIIPRIVGVILVQASLLGAVALLTQSGLAFLNLIVPVPAPSWGGMIADGASALEQQPWLIWPPGAAVAVTVLVLGILGDQLREVATEQWQTAPPRRAKRSRVATRSSVRASTDSVGPETLLSVRDVSVSFRKGSDRVAVLDEVSFDVRLGETLGLVGESGSGKSVTASAVMGLLAAGGRVDSGQIVLGGVDLTAIGDREMHELRGSEIALIAQEPMVALNPALRVGTQLVESLRLHRKLTRREARVEALALLRSVQLKDPEAVLGRYPHELSGGMAQRVVIARALSGDPKILIADEPTTALDVTVQAEILRLLKDLQQERGTSILLVTHDWGVVAQMCDRVAVMYAGQVVETAEVDDLFHAPAHPYSAALLESNPQHHMDAKRLPVISGSVPPPGRWPGGCHFSPRCSVATDACLSGAISVDPVGQERSVRCLHPREVVR